MIGIHGNSWEFMGIHNNSWAFIYIHGHSFAFMVMHEQSWAMMGCSCSPFGSKHSRTVSPCFNGISTNPNFLRCSDDCRQQRTNKSRVCVGSELKSPSSVVSFVLAAIFRLSFCRFIFAVPTLSSCGFHVCVCPWVHLHACMRSNSLFYTCG